MSIPDFSDELAHQASCYGLPYGIFGIICWVLSYLCISLAYFNYPLFSPWMWNKQYKSQNMCFGILLSIMTIVPAIYTCVRCRGEWMSFKMLNDGIISVVEYKNTYESNGYSTRIRTESETCNCCCIQTNSRDPAYRDCGIYITLPLSLLGWIGITALSIKLMKTEKAVTQWIWGIYLVALLALVITCVICLNIRKKHGAFILEGKERNKFTLLWSMMMYLLVTFHIIGSHIILAMASGNWSGIAPTGAGLASAIVFFIAKRLLFLNI
uniref:Uncharacterized protein n=4 Tax=Rhizophagus irregularis TaxID=588596 RepID=U9SY70_RHIID